MAKTAASTISKAAINPKTAAATIQTLALRREAIFSVTSTFASWISFRTRSARSERRSVRACTRPEFSSRSWAMELSRPALEALRHGVVLHRAFRRTALEHAEREETGKRSEAEHERGLLAGEIGRRPSA